MQKVFESTGHVTSQVKNKHEYVTNLNFKLLKMEKHLTEQKLN